MVARSPPNVGSRWARAHTSTASRTTRPSTALGSALPPRSTCSKPRSLKVSSASSFWEGRRATSASSPTGWIRCTRASARRGAYAARRSWLRASARCVPFSGSGARRTCAGSTTGASVPHVAWCCHSAGGRHDAPRRRRLVRSLIVPRTPVDLLAAGASIGITSVRSVFWQVRRSQNHLTGIRALFYHRVSDDRDELAVTPARFREQMAFLAQGGYRAVAIVTASELLTRGECPSDVIALSFDDGYLDVAQNAMPVLEQYGFKATVFVVTGAADGRVSFSWYRREHPPVLQWRDIVALDRDSALLFEAHSVTHPKLPALSDDRARAEIVDCKSELEERLG